MSMVKALVLMLMFFAVSSNAADETLDDYISLTSDVKSSRMGEPVTVFVVESTNAESSAGTGVQRDSSVDASLYDSVNGVSAGGRIGFGRNGKGATSRTGRVKTQLSTRIVEVVSKGLFKIQGEHDLLINGERQIVKVSGLIRSVDLSRSNGVFSYQIADAKIEIVGEGDLSRVQKQNVVSKVFQWLGLL